MRKGKLTRSARDRAVALRAALHKNSERRQAIDPCEGPDSGCCVIERIFVQSLPATQTPASGGGQDLGTPVGDFGEEGVNAAFGERGDGEGGVGAGGRAGERRAVYDVAILVAGDAAARVARPPDDCPAQGVCGRAARREGRRELVLIM